jgi:hypothetical protein
MHWLAADLGAAGPVPAVLVEFLRDLQGSPDRLWDFWALFHRRTRPSEVLTPERFTAVAERVAGTSLGPQVMAELDASSELDEHRRRLVASPCFVEDAAHLNKASELRRRPARSRSVLIGDAGRVEAS